MVTRALRTDVARRQAHKRSNDISVKIDSEAVRIARNVATYRDKSLAEYLSELVRRAAQADWEAILDDEQSRRTSMPIEASAKSAKT